MAACNSDPTGPALGSAFALTAGSYHTCALSPDGVAYCWGFNDAGQAANGTLSRLNTPLPVPGDLTFRALAAGRVHTCGIATDETLHCWGDNSIGMFGDPEIPSAPFPQEIVTAPSLGTLSGGAFHNCGLEPDGSPWCWGSNSSGQLGSLETVTRCSGTPCSDIPLAVAGRLRLQSLVTGTSHTCGITLSGATYCWGANGSGQLGNGFDVASAEPVLVTGEIGFTRLSAGATHTCGIADDGVLYCWGRNTAGQLGVEATTDGCGTTQRSCAKRPIPVETSLRFRSVAAGGEHTCALTADAELYCWGRNRSGQLGNGSTTDSFEPRRIVGGLRVAHVALGQEHSCAATVGGEVYCWGDHLRGQLGVGEEGIRRLEPTLVPFPGAF